MVAGLDVVVVVACPAAVVVEPCTTTDSENELLSPKQTYVPVDEKRYDTVENGLKSPELKMVRPVLS